MVMRFSPIGTEAQAHFFFGIGRFERDYHLASDGNPHYMGRATGYGWYEHSTTSEQVVNQRWSPLPEVVMLSCIFYLFISFI